MPKEKEERKIAVVSELPNVPTRIAVGDDKEEYELITRDEALTEILQTTRELKEKL